LITVNEKTPIISISVTAVRSEEIKSVGDEGLCSCVKYEIQDGKEELNNST
jgi:hypothetical protein